MSVCVGSRLTNVAADGGKACVWCWSDVGEYCSRLGCRSLDEGSVEF